MADLAGLAVHQALGPDHFAAISLPDRLVAQADPQDRQVRRRPAQQRQADPGLVGRTGPRRQQHRFRRHGQGVLHRDLVVAPDKRLCPQLVHIVDEVVGEAVVVIDHQDHGSDVELRRPGAKATDAIRSSAAHASLRPPTYLRIGLQSLTGFSRNSTVPNC